MDEPRKSVFDWRDGKPPQSAPPSATASALRQSTQSALGGAGQSRSRQVNTMPNVFDLPNPYPTARDAPQVPDRGGSNIRYMTPDGRPPGDPLNTSQRNTKDLFAQARRTNNLADRSALLREAMGSQDFDRAALSARTDLDTTRQRLQSAGDVANVNAQVDTNNARLRSATDFGLGEMSSLDQRYGIDSRERSSLASDALRATTSRENNRESVAGRTADNEAQLGYYISRDAAERNAVRGSYTPASHMDAMREGLITAGTQDELFSLEMALAGATPQEKLLIKDRINELEGRGRAGGGGGLAAGGLVRGYAGGGIVEPGMGAPPALAQPLAPDPALIAKYTQYAEGAQAMGLTTVGFEEFAQMSRGARAATGTAPPPSGAGAPVAMAEGGEVPAGGKMVIDSDPNAPTDSIPAVIDGKTPAALDSGELVFPRHAVLYYGTDKLNKMIAKSKEASEGGNGKSATGLHN